VEAVEGMGVVAAEELPMFGQRSMTSIPVLSLQAAVGEQLMIAVIITPIFYHATQLLEELVAHQRAGPQHQVVQQPAADHKLQVATD
jgi:hypothetical protein